MCKGDFEGFTSLTEAAKLEVKWLEGEIPLSFRNIDKRDPNLTITTDASLLGWGAVREEQTCGGQWTEKEREQHINVVELEAVYFGLKTLTNGVECSHIRIRFDSSTAVSYTSNLGA